MSILNNELYVMQLFYQMYQSHLEQCPNKQVKAALKVGKFTAECVEICWFMVVSNYVFVQPE
jgi:hypothetical protein